MIADASIVEQRSNTLLSKGKKRVLFTVLAFVSLYLVSYIIDPYSPHWKFFFDRPVVKIIRDWGITLVFSFLISEASIFIHNQLNQSLSWMERPGKRLIAETSLNLLFVLISNLVITLYFLYFTKCCQLSPVELGISLEKARGIFQWVAVSAMIAIIIMGINIGDYLIKNWKNEVLRAAELNQVAMEAELQSLKLQIDPHFVFNNLSVLSELILENQQLGYEYAENFSKIYRYMLVNSKKNTILLEDELKFLDSYMFLIEQRLGKGVHFSLDVDNESRQLSMPPLTLQLLVENALKHNRTNKKEPLDVRIYTNAEQELVVENTLLPIEKPLDSSGIGIKNIIRRYNLLSAKEPKIVKSTTSFKVSIPLIKL